MKKNCTLTSKIRAIMSGIKVQAREEEKKKSKARTFSIHPEHTKDPKSKKSPEEN